MSTVFMYKWKRIILLASLTFLFVFSRESKAQTVETSTVNFPTTTTSSEIFEEIIVPTVTPSIEEKSVGTPSVPISEDSGQNKQEETNVLWEDILGISAFKNIVNLGDADLRTIIVRLINVGLSFLGVIFLLMILYSGLLFIFSFGKEEALAQAKRSFFHALVGLLIIFLANSIVLFVFRALSQGTGITFDFYL